MLLRLTRASDLSEQRRRLVHGLRQQEVIRSHEVGRALLTVPREEFVWPDMRQYAYTDSPLPLGATGQTISAPHMVAIMLEELRLEAGLRVLEIGAGSGYNAALMAEVVNPTGGGDTKGRVVTVDREPELVAFARANLTRTGYADRVEVVQGDGTLGYPERSEEERYERIIVTAAAPYIPRYLRAQLKSEGVILVPVGDLWMQNLVRGMKDAKGHLRTRQVCGCMFVPLVGEDGHRELRY